MPDELSYEDLANPETVHEADLLAQMLRGITEGNEERDDMAVLLALSMIFAEHAEFLDVDPQAAFEQASDFIESGGMEDVLARDPARGRFITTPETRSIH